MENLSLNIPKSSASNMVIVLRKTENADILVVNVLDVAAGDKRGR